MVMCVIEDIWWYKQQTKLKYTLIWQDYSLSDDYEFESRRVLVFFHSSSSRACSYVFSGYRLK